MLNRKNPPSLGELTDISFVTPELVKCTPSLPLYLMKKVPNATSRIDFYFDAGTTVGSNVISALTSGLLFSGTKDKTSTQIHNELDSLGAYFDVGLGFETAIVTFYALNEQLPAVVKLFVEMMENATFPSTEVEELINDRKQKLQINLEKVSFLAQRKFQGLIFDGTHYNRTINLEDYNSVSREEIVSYFEKNYKKGLKKVFLVGDFKEEVVSDIANSISSWAVEKQEKAKLNFQNKAETVHVEKANAVQTAIRVGKTLFNKTHPDYFGFMILNTILGDFFGSRLMKNIREDKGYTYGIGSYLSEIKDSGYFVIGTEVGKEVKEATLTEIRKEIEQLQQELVSEEELNLVRNYLLGQTLKSADGPYALMELFLSVENQNLDLDFFNDFIHKIKSIQAEELRELAKKYLDWDSFSIVSAG
jgi:predicted Zn-dependent peptidase